MMRVMTATEINAHDVGRQFLNGLDKTQFGVAQPDSCVSDYFGT
jgi:hypothetical protein